MAGLDFGRFDIYRKIPRDLTKGTVSGAGLSFFGVFFLTVLFIFELNSYLSGNTASPCASPCACIGVPRTAVPC